MFKKKIVIGTANFGKKYGNFTQKEKVKSNEIKNIFNYLNKNKINFLDTAYDYQNENELENLKISKWNLITKIHYRNLKRENYIINLKKKLGFKKYYGILIHIKNTNEILNKKNIELFNFLKYLKKKGVTKKIGFSIYEPDHVKLLLKNFKFNLIQCPINILDTRLIKNGYLKKLKNKNIEIHARSIFLQGLLLSNLNKIPKKFSLWKKISYGWENYLIKKNISKLEYCLDFINNVPEVDKIVVGLNNLNQLKETLNILKKIKNKNKKIINFKFIYKNSTKLIDPRKWN